MEEDGSGPHTFTVTAWFNHIPGLKVVMPTFADDARSLLIESIFDPNPVIFFRAQMVAQQQII